MNLNDDLKLVIDVGDLKAYHQPISKAVYDANFLILSGTHGTLFGRGIEHAMRVGPRIAALTLKDEGKRIVEERGIVDGKDFGASALLAEIRRQTTILAPSSDGWDYMPVEKAIAQNKIDSEDWEETEAELVFFTSVYYSASRRERNSVLKTLAEVLEVTTTVSSCEEYANSLQTSSEVETGKKRGSSVPV